MITYNTKAQIKQHAERPQQIPLNYALITWKAFQLLWILLLFQIFPIYFAKYFWLIWNFSNSILQHFVDENNLSKTPSFVSIQNRDYNGYWNNITVVICKLKSDCHLQKRLIYLLQLKPFEIDEKCLLFYLKLTFYLEDI